MAQRIVDYISIIRNIGHGTFGIVYSAETKWKSKIAIKVVSKRNLQSKTVRDYVQNEAYFLKKN